MNEAYDLRALKAFIILADSGSFATASTILQRDPTSLSRRLQGLEAALGVRLADRTTRSFTLTEAGQAFLARIRPVLNDLDAAAREVATFGTGEPRGRLRIALPGSFARLWLEPVLIGFLQRYPGISLDAHYTNSFVDLVGQGFDAAVRLGELSDSRLVARKVANRRRLICASPAYLERRGTPESPQDISDHACLCFTGTKEPNRWDFQRGDEPTISTVVNCYVASDDADVLVRAARAGLGLYRAADWHAGPHLASGELIEVLQQWTVVDNGAIHVLVPSLSRMPTKTRAFSDWIANALASPPWLTKSDSC